MEWHRVVQAGFPTLLCWFGIHYRGLLLIAIEPAHVPDRQAGVMQAPSRCLWPKAERLDHFHPNEAGAYLPTPSCPPNDQAPLLLVLSPWIDQLYRITHNWSTEVHLFTNSIWQTQIRLRQAPGGKSFDIKEFVHQSTRGGFGNRRGSFYRPQK